MIVVTGGTGLLGAHLLYDLVKSGKQVRAIKRRSSDIDNTRKIFSYYTADDLFSKIEWMEGDVLDIFSLLSSISAADEVYHCAAMVSFSKKDRFTSQIIVWIRSSG